MNTTTKVLLTAVAAGAAGVIAGILMAPDKGEKTRAKLRKKSKELGDNIQEFTEKSRETLEDLKKAATNAVNFK